MFGSNNDLIKYGDYIIYGLPLVVLVAVGIIKLTEWLHGG